MMEFFRTLRRVWCSIQLTKRYGPDIATFVAKNKSGAAILEALEDADREALKKWWQEGLYLLPRRYKLILDKLLGEGLISSEQHAHYAEASLVAITGPGKTIDIDGTDMTCKAFRVQFPWIEIPAILSQASDSLRVKIDEFVIDHQKYFSVREGAMFLQTFYPPE